MFGHKRAYNDSRVDLSGSATGMCSHLPGLVDDGEVLGQLIQEAGSGRHNGQVCWAGPSQHV